MYVPIPMYVPAVPRPGEWVAVCSLGGLGERQSFYVPVLCLFVQIHVCMYSTCILRIFGVDTYGRMRPRRSGPTGHK